MSRTPEAAVDCGLLWAAEGSAVAVLAAAVTGTRQAAVLAHLLAEAEG